MGIGMLIFLLGNITPSYAQPANDNVCQALEILVGCPAEVVDNANATVEANENSIVPPTSTNCIAGTWCDQSGPDGGAGFNNSVWFKFTAPATTTVLIDICASSFDSQLALYQADDCSDFSSFTWIWATDDQAGCGNFVDENGDTQTDLSSTLRIECLVPGEEYLIAVDAWQNAAGDADTLGNVIISIIEDDQMDPGVNISNVVGLINPQCPGGEDGAIDISLITGVEPVLYEWSNGDSTQDLTNIASGTYTVTVTDFCGTTQVASYDLEDPDEPEALTLAQDNVEVVHPTHCGDYAYGGQLTATVASGVGPYQYQWSNGETDPHIDSLSDGTYTLTVTDACGVNSSVKTYTLGASAGPDMMCDNNSQVQIGVDNSQISGRSDALSYTDLVVDDLNIG